MGIIAVTFLAQNVTQGRVTEVGLLFGPAVQHGQWWRMITAGFLHGNLIHIGANLFFLLVISPQMERLFGTLRFVLIYIGALVGSSMTVMFFDFGQATVGASGAALGLAGAMGVALHERGVPPQKSPIFRLALLNLALPLLVPVISFWGHLGGIVTGAVMGYLLIWRPARSKSTTQLNTMSSAIVAIVIFTVLGLLAAHFGGLPLP